MSDQSNTNEFPGYIDLFVEQIATDPVQYKPYNPLLKPVQALVLRVPVEDLDLIVDYCKDDEVIVIGLDGFRFLLATIANAIQDMNNARLENRD